MAYNKLKRSKYGAKRTNGFASKLESAVYEKLLEQEKLGQIKDIKCQQTVVLQEGASDVRIAWKVDFSFFNLQTNEVEYAEAKGFETADYVLKLKIWRFQKPATLYIWKGSHAYPKIAEIIQKK